MNIYAAMMSDTLAFIESNEKLKAASSRPVEVFLYGKIPSIEPQVFPKPAEIKVTKLSSSQAVLASRGEHTAVLNFASAYNPGGGVRGGANAQEEALCRVSTLLPTLESEKAASYYRCRKNGAFYSDSAILSKDVIFFKSDDGRILPESDWATCDVLTVAAPNYGDCHERRGYEEVLEKRIDTVFRLALYSQADVLILGAFGCGVFVNPPQAVATAFKEAQKKYSNHFKRIEYAILAYSEEDINYSTFKKVLLH